MSTRATRQTNTESRIIKFQKKNNRDLLESLKIGGSESARGIGSSGSESVDGGSPNINPNPLKISELGDITNPLVIDFGIHSDRQLTGNVDGNTTITFAHIPTLLLCTIRLHIRSTDPIITLGGTIVSGIGSSPLIVTAVNDFLDISFWSTDQSTINIGTTKKNDESELAPTIPLNVVSSGHTDTTIDILWDPSAIGSLPLTYDVEYSLSAAETNGVPDTPITDAATKNLTDTKVTVNGLSAGTTYYFWVRAKNDVGNSDYIGPLQTNTDGSYNAGDVGFSVTALDFNTIRASWTQPTGKQLRFTLIRDLGIPLETVVKDDTPSSGVTNTYDDDFLPPNTLHDYIFEVRNEFGTLISTILASATTSALAAPTVVFENVGTKLKFTVTLEAGINIAEVEWNLSNAVDGNGSFTGQGGSTKITRPVGVTGQTNVIFETESQVESTLFYGHARILKNQVNGPFSTIVSDTTGTLSTPSKPTLTVTSPATGQIRIKVTYPDSPTRDEIALVTWRLQSSVQEYFDTIYDTGTTTIANSYSRNQPPSDDLNALENKVEVIREGAFSPGDSITVRCVLVNASGTSLADTDNVLVDS
ncbi:MAG: fibronectin type III domain-containing protein [Deltaproteobacteria bacterium]|nr:fibronectin type III domain-containing protein [Deltaproteobacteria bacterium]